ncbi:MULTISPECIES: queuosine precursor transporter [Kocuria]|uniref:queuosine precursor transporter n=1 Tax=Kocuria TaxID=57493 RepID=UPI00203AA893|nr:MULTISPECIES: queuosine precursor transporter [Kocuria]MCM3686556.1 queuosine precursor transporter [Kocuria rosea]HST70959.1 queuosine precursor transporter [Kocuria rosea]
MSSPASPAAPAGFARRPRTWFDLIVAAYCVVLVLSNVAATKGVAFGPVITDGGFFLFPLAYVLGDVVSEVYGFRAARRAILSSFAAGLLASVVFWIVIALPPAEFYTGQAALETVLGPVPLIVAGSLLGYLAGQLLNAFVLVRLKARTRERHLWARLISSTALGELVDTLIFCTVAAPVIGITTLGDFLNYALIGYAYKVAVEIVVLPVTYAAIRWLKRHEPTYGVAGLAGEAPASSPVR